MWRHVAPGFPALQPAMQANASKAAAERRERGPIPWWLAEEPAEEHGFCVLTGDMGLATHRSRWPQIIQTARRSRPMLEDVWRGFVV